MFKGRHTHTHTHAGHCVAHTPEWFIILNHKVGRVYDATEKQSEQFMFNSKKQEVAKLQD